MSELSKKMYDRAEAIMEAETKTASTIEQVFADTRFIRECFSANEVGDALLLAAFLHDRFIYVPPPPNKAKDPGLWYKWGGVVWELCMNSEVMNEVEHVCQAYQILIDDVLNQKAEEIVGLEEEREQDVEELKEQITKAESGGDDKEVEKLNRSLRKLHNTPLPVSTWFKKTIDSMESRIKSLRTLNRMNNVLKLAPVKDSSISIQPNLFDKEAWLFPCANGVIDLSRGTLVEGRPSDIMTRKSDVIFDENIDYSDWEKLVANICVHPDVPGSEEVPAFLKRFFGYCLTGVTKEEAICFFLGGGRNGKGTILEPFIELMGPFFHQANRTLFTKQRFDPPPGAASEHLFALMGKRLSLGSEPNEGDYVDEGRIKALTGGNKVNFRRNFGSEEVFTPCHKFIIDSNYVLKGMASAFSLIERWIILDFPWRHVDDPEESAKREPALANRFRKKDNSLKAFWKQPENLSKVLAWAVDGCTEWQEIGLAPPQVTLDYKIRIAKDDNHVARFIEDMLVAHPGEGTEFPFALLYEKVFVPWWRENMDSVSTKVPIKSTLSKALREGGYKEAKIGGNLYFFDVDVRNDVKLENKDMSNLTSAVKANHMEHYQTATGIASPCPASILKNGGAK